MGLLEDLSMTSLKVGRLIFCRYQYRPTPDPVNGFLKNRRRYPETSESSILVSTIVTSPVVLIERGGESNSHSF